MRVPKSDTRSAVSDTAVDVPGLDKQNGVTLGPILGPRNPSAKPRRDRTARCAPRSIPEDHWSSSPAS